MSVLTATVAVLTFVALCVLIYAVTHAPFGWEDNDGFHLGDQPNYSTGRPPMFLVADEEIPGFEFNRDRAA